MSDNQIHLVTINNANQAVSEADLTSEAGLPSTDSAQYSDWSPDGSSIIFDSNLLPPGDTSETGSNFVWVLNVSRPSESALWTQDPGNEIEPLFSPTGTQFSPATGPTTASRRGSRRAIPGPEPRKRPTFCCSRRLASWWVVSAAWRS